MLFRRECSKINRGPSCRCSIGEFWVLYVMRGGGNYAFWRYWGTCLWRFGRRRWKKMKGKEKGRWDDDSSIRGKLKPPPSFFFLKKKKHSPNTHPTKLTSLVPIYLYRWYRPRATKKMTVELSRASGPFIWPAEPTDFSAWSKNVYDTSAREKEAEEKRISPDAATLEKEDGAVLRRQAERLLRGEERWRGKWAVP